MIDLRGPGPVTRLLLCFTARRSFRKIGGPLAAGEFGLCAGACVEQVSESLRIFFGGTP